MSKIDIAISIVLLLGGYLGFKRGFLLGLFFLLSIVLGVFLAFKLMAMGVIYLHNHFNADLAVFPYLSFLIIFILVLGLVMFIGNRFKNSMDKTFLGKVDSIAGALLGVFKYAFCLSVLFWLLAAIGISFPNTWLKDSYIYPLTVKFAKQVNDVTTTFAPFLKGIFKKF